MAKIGRRLGISKQAVDSSLKYVPNESARCVPCSCCGEPIISPGASPADVKLALCLPCLEQAPNANFAQRLMALRLAAGLTQAELARRAGMTLATVCEYRRNKRKPQQHNLAKLARVLPGLRR